MSQAYLASYSVSITKSALHETSLLASVQLAPDGKSTEPRPRQLQRLLAYSA
jgi:hypothetical protein